MTAYKYSTTTDGGSIAFEPLLGDTFAFDTPATGLTAIFAANLSITASGTDLIFVDSINFKTFTLLNVELAQLTSTNITFASGSILMVGDNATGTANDNNANSLVGGAKADLLYGMGGNDTLNGGVGADVLIGGDGNDTYKVDNAGDQVNEDLSLSDPNDPIQKAMLIDSVQSTVTYTLNTNVENLQLYVGATIGTTNIDGTGNSQNNIITGNSGSNILQGLEGNDTISGGQGSDNMYGGDGDDRLDGAAGNDLLDGGTGIDTLIGGNGNDTYTVDSTGDIVKEITADAVSTTTVIEGGLDTVQSSVTYTLDVNLENLVLTGDSNNHIDGTGNKLSNSMTGNAGNNILNGISGADTYNGGAGNDTYYVNSTNDSVTETTVGVARFDAATLVKLQQSRFGYDPANFTDIDMVKSAITYTLPANIEQLQLLGSSNINATGNALNNIFYANVGNNVFTGGGGIDTVSYQPYQPEIQAPNLLIGGFAAVAGVTVSLAVGTAQATGGSGSDTLSGIRNLIGSQYNDTLTGTSAVNVLDGGAGADSLVGGDGNDIYFVDGADIVSETIADDSTTTTATEGGIDTVYSSADYVLPTNVEMLTLIGTNPLNGTGNGLNNTIIGNELANIISGAGGADRLEGLGGDDTYVIDSFDTVVEAPGGGTADTIVAINLSKVLPSEVENLKMIGSVSLNGTGNVLQNIIYANAGNSVIDGVAHTDGFIDDTVSYELGTNQGNYTYTPLALSYTGVVVDLNLIGISSLGTAQNTGGSGTDKLTHISNITGSAYNDIFIEYTNVTGANTLDGKEGIDTVSYANSIYRIDVNLGGSDGQGSAINYDTSTNEQKFSNTLVNIENVIGSAHNDSFIVSPANNVIKGGAGLDTVSYQGSPVSVEVDLNITTEQTPAPGYYLGYDTLTGIENLTGSSSADILTGNTGNNSLKGADGADLLIGGAGVDTLTGGLGADTLTGGTGKDSFVFDTADTSRTDINNPALGKDIITDFSNSLTTTVANRDVIDLSAIRPDDTTTTLSFNFRGTSALNGVTGNLNYSVAGGNAIVEGIDDNGTHFHIQLTGVISLTAADFIL